MSLAVPKGENIKLIATGEKAEKAIADIEKILS
jgi:phosphotransferase system HPr-like phosphotransfer protein